MNKMTLVTRKLSADTKGAHMAEYVIVGGCVAIVCIAGAATFGSTILDKFNNQAGTIGKIPDGKAATP